MMGDTWEFDGTTWSERFTAGPQPQFGHDMAYDAANNAVLLNGLVGSQVGTWHWSGDEWIQLPVTETIYRTSHSMAFDSARQVTVRFGGEGLGGTEGSETWQLRYSVPAVCNDIDFNNDGSSFDPQDIEAFLSFYSEGPCVPESATCNDIDFNNDTSVFDPCDINSFLVVYSEGPCTPCGS